MPMLKRVVSKNNVTVLKARGKRALADVSCYCKMTSVMALGVSSFLHFNVVINTCKRMRHSPTIGGILQCNSGRLFQKCFCHLLC